MPNIFGEKNFMPPRKFFKKVGYENIISFQRDETHKNAGNTEN